ncbi:YbjN domain-containing protein [Siculibacillus lacustris]|uniref:YbjN domain-containing protein n=1 Tax=Siculibacillus lacustris TaxID=1549641 RepID=A0A4Q9VN37_9HYPH|nr:YbjN domain-containing protein [Siculibacillus lacustris]TBW37052.1 YbjN domain-containing protein [Siculibacillus lacustris]
MKFAALVSGSILVGSMAASAVRAETPSELGAAALGGYTMITAFAGACKFEIEKPIAAVLDGNIRALVTKLAVPAGTVEAMTAANAKQLSGHEAESCVWGPDKFNAMIAEMAKESLAAATKAGVEQAPIPPSKRPLSSFPPDAAANPVKEKAQAGIGGYVAILAIGKLCDFTADPATVRTIVDNVNALQPKSELSDKDIDAMVEAGVANFGKDKAKYCGPGPAKYATAVVDMAKYAVAAAEGSGVALKTVEAPKAEPAPAAAPAASPVAKAPAPVTSPPAGSGTLTGADAEAIAAIARAYGEATVSKDKNGDPTIKVRSKGAGWTMSFYGCEKGTDCLSIELYHGFETDAKPSPERINEWNRTKRWGKAYLDKDGDPNLNFDINLRGGVMRANLDSDIARWVDMIGDFKAFVAKK